MHSSASDLQTFWVSLGTPDQSVQVKVHINHVCNGVTKLVFCTHLCCIHKQVSIQVDFLHALNAFLSNTVHNISSGGSLHARQRDDRLKEDMPVRGYVSRAFYA